MKYRQAEVLTDGPLQQAMLQLANRRVQISKITLPSVFVP